jgi:hypothetical protein
MLPVMSESIPSAHLYPSPRSLSGPHFTARMSRAAIEGLLAAHGAAIATVSCDPTVGIDDVEDGQEVGGGAERLWEKVQCGGQQVRDTLRLHIFSNH